MLRSRDTLRYVLEKPLVDQPGRVFRYSTGTCQLLSGVLQAATGTTALEYARTRLFGPLGIDGVRWPSTRDGVTCGGTHLYLTARQLLAIGLLCLQRGEWRGRQVVSGEWIDESTLAHAGLDWWEGPYGYGWWIRPYGYAAYGYGGQFAYVAPSARLVVVMTARASGHILIRDFEALVVERLLAERAE
jgi:CubicO group peptidase (beta-lactamase class C family)